MNARGLLALRVVLTLLVVGGLAIDAYVHLHIAHNYVHNNTSTLSEADLFRLESVVAILAAIAALATLVQPRRYLVAIAFVVSASALAALLVYRYVNIKAIGPFPSMYEPIWFSDKTLAAYAEAVATGASAVLFGVLHAQHRATVGGSS